MKVRELVKNGVHTVGPETPIDVAANLMRSVNIGCLPVVEYGKPVGVVTDRDITIRTTANGDDPKHASVSQAMTTPAITIGQDEDISQAVELMRAKEVGRLLICDDAGKLVGVLSAGDVAILSHGNEQAGRLAEALAARSRASQELVMRQA